MMRGVRDVAIAVALVGATEANAGEFWIEGPPQSTKPDAAAQEAAGDRVGLEARVVRRYVEDQGWRYVVIVEEWPSEAEARVAALRLAAAASAPVTVFTRDGKDAREVAVVESGAPTAVAAAAPVDPEVSRILAAAVAAHGGSAGGGPVVGRASTVRFEYERVLEGGLKVRHVYLRTGVDQALQVRVIEGSGIDSETRFVSGAAWLQTGREAFSTQDPGRARELLDQAAPAGIIPFVLVFGTVASSRTEFVRLERGESVEVNGSLTDTLRFEGDRSSGPMVLNIEQKSGLIRQVSFEDGDLVHQFDEYTQVAEGLVVPKKVTTWKDGKMVETTTVSSLVLDGPIAEGSVARPGP